MKNYVVDASVAVKWFVPELGREAALRLWEPTCHLHVPEFFLLEVGNFVCKKRRRGEWNLAEGEFVMDKIRKISLTWHQDEPLFSKAFDLAHDTYRSLYDYLYLSLAIAIDGQMVTADLKFYESLNTGPYANRLLWVEDIPQSKDLKPS
jgi:predicted nucleic acid-binding protein